MDKRYFLHVLVLIGFLIFIPIFHFSKATVANQSDLNKLLEMVQIHDGKLTQWQVLARDSLDDTLSREDLDQMISSWKKHYSHFSWNYMENDGKIKWIGQYYNEQLKTVEQLQLTVDLSSTTLHGFVIYEMKSTCWKEQDFPRIEKELQAKIANIFETTPEVFSTIQGTLTDENTALMEQTLLFAHDLQADIVEMVHEPTFVALTAYSPHFSRELQTKNDVFNVQISLRTDDNGKETRFAIGTPILTDEY